MAVVNDAGGGAPVHTGPQPVKMPPLLCRTPHDWSRYSLEQIWGMVGRQSSVTGQVSADLWASILTLCRIVTLSPPPPTKPCGGHEGG